MCKLVPIQMKRSDLLSLLFQAPRKDYNVLATICHEQLSFPSANTVLPFLVEFNAFKGHGFDPRSKFCCLLLFNSCGNLLSKPSPFSLTSILNYLSQLHIRGLTGHYCPAKIQNPCAVQSNA